MVQQCNRLHGEHNYFEKMGKITNGQLVLGNGHNEMIKWALVVPDLAQVGPQLVPNCPNLPPVGSKLAQFAPKVDPKWPKLVPSWTQLGLH